MIDRAVFLLARNQQARVTEPKKEMNHQRDKSVQNWVLSKVSMLSQTTPDRHIALSFPMLKSIQVSYPAVI